MNNHNKPLTRRQTEALQFIKSFVSKNGYPPTVREIADHMQYQSASTAFQLLEVLVRKGYIKKGSRPRELQIVGYESMAEKDAEIARLREALVRIAGMNIIGSSAITMKSIANKALELIGGKAQ
ncbi:hypothetical protein [Paenibacillus lutimineralis]|uniref:LexA repressor DNA-binding domain-containing protein n=1 Tax=Paenibacillus lutimineralis TaxID=2707005 RepID=A0A3Q9ICX2_9BACL|nr:hypothetical protein [Paenibacillus lutimineralis]AZS15342.1 hypothetical protein EI981_13305 [Paenibacillus lutimineralis]